MGQSEEALGLQGIRSRHLFVHDTRAVSRLGRQPQVTMREEMEFSANLFLANDPFACLILVETEFRVSQHLRQFRFAHSLKEWELQ